MAGQKVWTLLLIIIGLSVPSVFCRYDYAQYYISKYHKASTTESIPSSTPGISATVASASSTGVSTLKDKFTPTVKPTDDTSSGEIAFPSEGSQITGPHANETVLQHGDMYGNNDFQTIFVVRIVIIVASVIFFVCVLGCIVCCCPGCRGKSRTGFVIGNRQDQAAGFYPQQPLISQPPPQQTAVFVQRLPPNYSQEAAQQYPQQPGQQYVHSYPQPPGQPQYPPGQPQPQYSPDNLQFYNPPEAPPPYEDKSTHKY